MLDILQRYPVKISELWPEKPPTITDLRAAILALDEATAAWVKASARVAMLIRLMTG